MRGNVRDFRFDKKAASYDAGIEGKLSQRFYNLLLRQVQFPPGALVLDVGCGTGTLLRKMADNFDICGFGIDAEEKMIAEAQKKYPEMTLGVSRCENTPFENNYFDALIVCMAYHHFADKDGFVKEAARIVKPGGRLYIADPRFPFFIRKTLNAVFAGLNVAGEFWTPEELFKKLRPYGFEPDADGVAFDGYAQVAKLIKSNTAIVNSHLF